MQTAITFLQIIILNNNMYVWLIIKMSLYSTTILPVLALPDSFHRQSIVTTTQTGEHRGEVVEEFTI